MKSSKFSAPLGILELFATNELLQLISTQHLVTTYFDDDEGRCYADQFRKTKRRFKVRLRQTDNRSVLEVKLKGGKGDKLRQIEASELDDKASEFIRTSLNSAFEEGFARGVEYKLAPVVITDFQRQTWTWAGEPCVAVDTDVLLRVGEATARLRSELALIEIKPDAVNAVEAARWLELQGATAVGFSKFGAAADLLVSERVRSHKPAVLNTLFALN